MCLVRRHGVLSEGVMSSGDEMICVHSHSFGAALKHLNEGRSVRRAGWHSQLKIVGIVIATFCIDEEPLKCVAWLPSHSDILAKDWEVVR